jgi:hypothetical protein
LVNIRRWRRRREDPVSAIPGAFSLAELQTFIHQCPISLRLRWNGENWDKPVVPISQVKRLLSSKAGFQRSSTGITKRQKVGRLRSGSFWVARRRKQTLGKPALKA